MNDTSKAKQTECMGVPPREERWEVAGIRHRLWETAAVLRLAADRLVEGENFDLTDVATVVSAAACSADGFSQQIGELNDRWQGRVDAVDKKPKT